MGIAGWKNGKSGNSRDVAPAGMTSNESVRVPYGNDSLWEDLREALWEPGIPAVPPVPPDCSGSDTSRTELLGHRTRKTVFHVGSGSSQLFAHGVYPGTIKTITAS